MLPHTWKKPANATMYRNATAALCRAEKPKTVVEVGVYAGDLSKLLADVEGVERLYLIDPWLGHYKGLDDAHMNAVADRVAAWASGKKNVFVIRAKSLDAVSQFADASIDFWHADADKEPGIVDADLEAWMPKVRRGGIMSGDNYEAPTVSGPVDRMFPKRKLAANGRLWWARL